MKFTWGVKVHNLRFDKVTKYSAIVTFCGMPLWTALKIFASTGWGQA